MSIFTVIGFYNKTDSKVFANIKDKENQLLKLIYKDNEDNINMIYHLDEDNTYIRDIKEDFAGKEINDSSTIYVNGSFMPIEPYGLLSINKDYDVLVIKHGKGIQFIDVKNPR